MVSSTSAMFESIAFHITRNESPVSFESAKENAPSLAKHSIKAGATNMSKRSVSQVAKELAMEQLPAADPTSQDVVFERHIYVPHSGTTLDGPSSADSCSAGPSRMSTMSHGSDILGRSLKDAMVLDFGVMTVMCFAGSPLKRDDTFDRSVISGNEEASLITIQNLYIDTPEPSPRASPIDLPEPNVISVKTRNSQDRAVAHISAFHMPLTAMFAQQQVLTVISDEGPDDEDIELNCNVEPSTEIHHTPIHQHSVDIYPQYFSSDSKSPSVTSTLTSGSVSVINQTMALTLPDDQNKSALGDTALKKNPSSTYAHGCFPSQAQTILDSISHGSSNDGNSTASTSPSTMVTSLVDNPVVKPSTWNDLFCNMNAGMQIFDFEDPDSPLALGCMSPTAAQVESQTKLDSKTSKSGHHCSPRALDCTNAKSNGDEMSLTCEEHKEPSLLSDESMEDDAKPSKTCLSSNDERGSPHTSPNSSSAMENNVTQKKTFEALLADMERLTAFERVTGNQDVCHQQESQDFGFEELDLSSVQDDQSIEQLDTAKTGEQPIPPRSESVESINLQVDGQAHGTVHELEDFRECTPDASEEAKVETIEELKRREKEEEEAIRKAYYLHRRQLYLESHAKSNAISDAGSFDDNDSEERPFDCGGPTKPNASKSGGQLSKGIEARTNTVSDTIEENGIVSTPSIHATYRNRKSSPRNVVTSGSPPPKPTLDGPLLPPIFNTPNIIEHPLLQEIARDAGDKNHCIPCSSISTSGHLNIPSHPGSSEERPSLVGSCKNNTERSERTLIKSPTNASAQSLHHKVNEGISTNFGNCRPRTNALKSTDPGNRCNNPLPTGNQAIYSKTSFQTIIDTSSTTDTENRHPHQRMFPTRSASFSTRSASDNSIRAVKKSETPVTIDSADTMSQKPYSGITPELWNIFQRKCKGALEIDGGDSRNMPENRGNTSGSLHPKSTQAALIPDSGRSKFQRTTIASLAADSGISSRFTTSSTDSGSSHLRTTSFGSTHDRGSGHNKSTVLNLASESGSSSHELRTMPSEGNSSHHRRTDRLHYLKMVRGVKVATRNLS